MQPDTKDLAKESDTIQAKLRMISEGVHRAEWPFINGDNTDISPFLDQLHELHTHVEACLIYVNHLQEEAGLQVLNGY